MTEGERLLIGAIRAAQDDLSDALQSDLENGVRWLNESAAAEFKRKYPALNAWIGKFMGTAEKLTSADRENERE